MSNDNRVNESSTEISKTEFRHRLRQLPPSSKLIIIILQKMGPQTFSNLLDESLLPERTLRTSLEKLEDSELVYLEDHLYGRTGQKYILTYEIE